MSFGRPSPTLASDLDRPDVVDGTEAAPTLLHYENSYHYQNILAPW